MSDNDSVIISTKRKSKIKEKNNITSKKSRKILTGKQKKILCQFAQDNPNFTQQELADKFEIGQTTVANILAQSLYWLGLDEEKNHLTITVLILQEKAKQVAVTLKILNFAASDGWLQGFKKRYHIVCTIHCEEAA
ncbi:25081_t:CDS:2, partial [Racocetra persica]